MKMAESSPNGQKNTEGKAEITRFKRLLLQTYKIKGLFGKRLTEIILKTARNIVQSISHKTQDLLPRLGGSEVSVSDS